MSDNNLHRIFENTACISTDMMIDYLDGKLSEKEKNRVEIHVASCEMCRDEFEGLSLLEDRSKLPFIVAELDKKIDEKIGGGGKKIPLFKNVYKIAAAIIVLISSAWLLNIYVSSGNLDESMVSQAMEENEDVEAPMSKVETDSIVEQGNKSTVEGKKEKEPNTIYRVESSKTLSTGANEKKVVVSDKETTTEEVYMEEDISVDEFSASTSDKVIVEETPVMDNKQLKEEQGFVQQKFKDDQKEEVEGEIDEDIVVDQVKTISEQRDLKTTREQKRRNRLFKGKSKKRSEAVMSNTAAFDNFDLAMAEYNQRDYKQAVELFKKSLGIHSNTDEVHFYLAKSYSNLNDTENALINYNKVIAMVESPYYEDALWNKSKLLIGMNKSKSAINSLNQLKTGKGVYSKKAGEIIDSLNINVQVEKDK